MKYCIEFNIQLTDVWASFCVRPWNCERFQDIMLKDENIMIDSMFKAKKPQYNHARKSQLVLDIMNDEDLNNSQPLFTPMFNSSLDIK